MRAGTWRSWFVAALIGLSAATPARASLIDFEDVTATLFSASSITSGGFEFTSDGFGLSGVDSAAAFVFGNAPANAVDQFLFMLNNDGMVMRNLHGRPFSLTSFQSSFIAPLRGLGEGIEPGLLALIGEAWNGSVVSDILPFSASDAFGNFNFDSFAPVALAGVQLRQLGFFACIYQTDGACSFNASDVPAQFALDNIAVSVPEPASALLVLLALGVLGATTRRRTR